MGVGGSCRSGFSRELLEPGCLGDWLETHPHPTLPLKGRALHRRACLSVRGRTASSSPSRGCPARRPLPTSARPCCRWGSASSRRPGRAPPRPCPRTPSAAAPASSPSPPASPCPPPLPSPPPPPPPPPP